LRNPTEALHLKRWNPEAQNLPAGEPTFMAQCPW